MLCFSLLLLLLMNIIILSRPSPRPEACRWGRKQTNKQTNKLLMNTYKPNITPIIQQPAIKPITHTHNKRHKEACRRLSFWRRIIVTIRYYYILCDIIRCIIYMYIYISLSLYIYIYIHTYLQLICYDFILSLADRARGPRPAGGAEHKQTNQPTKQYITIYYYGIHCNNRVSFIGRIL